MWHTISPILALSHRKKKCPDNPKHVNRHALAQFPEKNHRILILGSLEKKNSLHPSCQNNNERSSQYMNLCEQYKSALVHNFWDHSALWSHHSKNQRGYTFLFAKISHGVGAVYVYMYIHIYRRKVAFNFAPRKSTQAATVMKTNQEPWNGVLPRWRKDSSREGFIQNENNIFVLQKRPALYCKDLRWCFVFWLICKTN